MKTLGYKLYCRRCRRIIDVYECCRQAKGIPEANPEFDVITVCCSNCKNPIMKITRLDREGRDEG